MSESSVVMIVVSEVLPDGFITLSIKFPAVEDSFGAVAAGWEGEIVSVLLPLPKRLSRSPPEPDDVSSVLEEVSAVSEIPNIDLTTPVTTARTVEDGLSAVVLSAAGAMTGFAEGSTAWGSGRGKGYGGMFGVKRGRGGGGFVAVEISVKNTG